MTEAPLEAIRGGTPEENADSLRAALAGEPGPVLDCVVLNAGAAFVAAGRVTTVREGVDLARATIEAGQARNALDRLVAACAAV